MILRGLGDSDNGTGPYDSKTSAEDRYLLIEALDVGLVHLTGQDVSGATVLRVAATHPDRVRSLAAIEMGLRGFGLETLADITQGAPGRSASSPPLTFPRCCSSAASAGVSGSSPPPQ